jgi:signal transduction histidine kinase
VYNFFILILYLLLASQALAQNMLTGDESLPVNPVVESLSDYESNISGSTKILEAADTISDPTQRLDYILDLAWKNRNSIPELSLELSLHAIELADSMNDHFNLAKAYSFSGVSYRLLGDYNKAIESFFKGLSISKMHKIPQQEGYAYINIANLYIYLEFFTHALENLGPALEIAREINDKNMLSYIFLNRGRVLMHLDSIDTAITDIEQALVIRKETGNIPGQAVCYKYLGDIHYNRGNFNDAQINYTLALATVNIDQDRHLFANIKLQQARIYCRTNNYVAAEPLASNVIIIAEELNSRLLIHDALKVLSMVDMNTGNYERAARRMLKMNQYADTLFNQQLSEKVLGLEFQLERQRQQAELDLIRKDKEIQTLRMSRQRYISIGLAVFVVLLFVTGAVLLFLVGKLNQKNQQLFAQKEELKLINSAKDRLFLVIGHDLRGPVWNLRALIQLLSEDFDHTANPELYNNVRALSKAVQSVSDLLENLLYWAKNQDGKLSYKPAPTNLKEMVQKSLHPYRAWAEMKNLTIDFQASEDDFMVIADENMLQAVTRNLISNAIKYSFPTGKIEISILRIEDKYRFSVRDFGKGLSPDQIDLILRADKIPASKGTSNEPGSGIGLSLSKDFLSKHNSSIKVESSPELGTMFYFDVMAMDD